MKYRFALIMLMILRVFNPAYAQVTMQVVRGTIVDKISEEPIPGATVVVMNSDPLNGTTTDAEGKFTLVKVPVGKQALKISFLGYKEVVLQNLSVNAGKELVLSIALEEDMVKMNAVEITAEVEKNKPLNEMSTVSTRTFSVEETQKFAAAVNDPARMATSFAGVIQGMDGSNFISIRGNSPNAILWRMEGVEIPNPNHFSTVGTAGGGISILSSQLLTNSDFSTGAFAAEYGNALSGVFDLKLRKGNNRKREYTFQLGFLGADVAAEGPFKKGYEGSYLINYRYSTLSILSQLGVPLGDGITNFQDLSLNISLPTKKLGTFGIFGFGGLSAQTRDAKKDSLKWKEEGYLQYSSDFKSNTGAIGFSNVRLFNNQSYLKTVLVLSGTQNMDDESKLQEDYSTVIKEYYEEHIQSKVTLSSVYTQKINARSSIRLGLIAGRLGYNLEQKDNPDTTILIDQINTTGNTQTAQGFVQWNYKLTPKLTTNVGLHYFQLFLNNSNSIEPRASMKYEFTPRFNASLGYGLHSQLQPLGIYFAEVNTPDGIRKPNENLELSKAHHFVVSFDYNLNEFSHIKTEIYYQHLFDIPVTVDKTKTFSVINEVDGFATDPLNNTGLGRNMGLELTYERFLHRNFYYLFAGSLYDSKYKAANGTWYNTLYNTNYSVTLTMGKEWVSGEHKKKNRVFGVNIKTMYVGGLRYTPIDLDASIAADETKYDETRTFEEQNPDYFRFDLRISITRNYKRLTSTLALDIQNTTNRKNIGGQYYDSNTGEVKYWYQAPLLPILSYKIEF